MSITLAQLLNQDEETTTLLLLIANAFSVYTVTFSVLEFYYVKIILSAEKRSQEPEHTLKLGSKYRQMHMDVTQPLSAFLKIEIQKHFKGEENGAANGARNTNASQPRLTNQTRASQGTVLTVDSVMTQDIESQSDVVFVEVVTGKFASLNRLRAAARNSMWMSLLGMVLAIMKISMKRLHRYMTELEDSMAALIICLWWDFITFTGYCLFKDFYFQDSALIAAIITVPIAGDALLVKSGFPTLEFLIFVVCLVTLGVIPLTIHVFRSTFVGLVKKCIEAY